MPLIRPVPYDHPDREAMVALRHQVLRAPLGLAYIAEQLEAERDQLHLAAFEAGEVLGTLLLAFPEKGVVRLRQMAVRPDRAGAGLGRALIAEAEGIALRRGLPLSTLHARETARGFYHKLGYRVVGEAFVEVTLPHLAMEKRLRRLTAAWPVA